MKILVTGGAGYIGSHMVRMLAGRSVKTVVLDSLEHGYQKAIPEDTILYTGNVGDREFLRKVFSDHSFDGVIHFAGYISVGESVEKPGMYLTNNLIKPMELLGVMEEFSVSRLLFSSTAAVYGTPQKDPIPEDHRKLPDSPYGLSKWNFEEMLSYFDRKGSVRSISLRYFNAAGADFSGTHGEAHRPENHIIPRAIAAALGNTDEFHLYGTDYPTEDGTCVRDYIHVEDLCTAHLRAFEALQNGHPTDAYNVGTGVGHSNREVINAVVSVSGIEFPVVEKGRRPGDPHSLVADSTKLKEKMGWKPRHSDLKTIIESAWKWHKNNPEGYGRYY